MQTNIKEFFDAKELPPWLVKHSAFKSISQVSKIFPRIGLENCTEPCVFENVESAMASGEALITQLKENIWNPYYGIHNNYTVKARESNPAIARMYSILQQFNTMLGNPKALLNKSGGKVSINLCEPINGLDKKPIYRKGTGLFKVYNSIRDELVALNIRPKPRKLEKIALFKAFSSVNIPTDKFSIVFSSDGVDGLWDIATMSMRGISSCQRWHGQYRHCLIGSIVDPFTAVIYLTSGNKYKQLGTKMARRAVVRFVVNSSDKKPYILIDRIYPSYDEEAVKKFIEFITKKTGGKFNVLYGPTMNGELRQHSYIPTSNVNEVLVKHNNFSYQDTKISIGKIEDKAKIVRDTNLKTRQANFTHRIYSAVAPIKFTYDDLKVKDTDSKDFTEYLTKVVTGADFRYHMANMARKLADKICRECAPLGSEDPNEYTRRLCYFYFSNKNRLLKAERAYFTRNMNSYYITRANKSPVWNSRTHRYDAPKGHAFKFRTENFDPAFKNATSHIATAIKKYAIETMKTRKEN